MDRPQVINAPGLVWKPRKSEWVAIWQPRTDLVKRGYPAETKEVWRGPTELTERDHDFIAGQCQAYQQAMLMWGHGGVEVTTAFDGRLASLIDCYKTDPDSRYNKKLRYTSKVHYDNLMKRLAKDYGDELIETIDARQLLRWHEGWVAKSGVPMAHGVMGMLRTLATYGTLMLKNAHCKELKFTLHDMRFEMAKPRTSRLTYEHAVAIINWAHETGRPSIAMAQAFQFDCMLRQKDVIGEWVPLSEPGASDVIHQRRGEKWLRGIRWSEIDQNLILKHTTSKRNKDVEIDLKLSSLVMAEFKRYQEVHGELPKSGPIIISEYTGRPWQTMEFRRRWRRIADQIGIPKTIRNMDSRSGAISEASLAGAQPDHIRINATHSQFSQTANYTRIQREASDNVMQLRAAHRNKK